MKVSVTYWREGRAVSLDGPDWHLLPVDGVLWVEVGRGGLTHRLLGADGYWVDGDRYGVTYDGRTRQLYGGCRYAAWRWPAGGAVPLGDVPPPQGAHVIRGVQVTDEVWADLMREA